MGTEISETVKETRNIQRLAGAKDEGLGSPVNEQVLGNWQDLRAKDPGDRGSIAVMLVTAAVAAPDTRGSRAVALTTARTFTQAA